MRYIAAALKKLRKPLIALAVVVAVLALVAYVTRPREPVYEGKRLSEWVEFVKSSDTKERGLGAAAIKAMGTNALPVFMEMLDAKDSKLELWLQRLTARQNVIPWEMETARDEVVNGLIGLEILGESARPALPKLKELFLSDAPGTTGAMASIPIAICDLDAIAFFADCLTYTNPQVRRVSAQRLGFMRAKARPAVPQLIAALKDEDRSTRKYAARSLGFIDHESEHILGLLIPMLDDPDYHVRSGVASGIAEFGPRAQSVVPKLTKMAQETNEVARTSATYALKQILGADFEQATQVEPR